MAKFVRRTRNGARLCEGPPYAKNRPRALPHPKIPSRSSCAAKMPKKRVGYNLGGRVWPSSSAGLGMGPDIARGLRVPKIGRGHCRTQNKHPKVRSPSSSAAKMPKKRVGYSLGGRGWPSSSAGLGMGPDFARGLRVPKIGRGYSYAQKKPPERPVPMFVRRKNAQKKGGL